MRYLRDFLFGLILGIANVIPAVSGGTMAVILGIYDDILYAISLKNIGNHLRFLIPLAVGCLAGIFLFSNIMLGLLENYNMQLSFAFIGLILGSIPMIYKRARYEKVKARNVAVFFLALAFMVFLTYIEGGGVSTGTVADATNLGNYLYIWLVIASAISTIAMILPGISGSFVMLLLGCYTLLLEAVASFNFTIIGLALLGVLIGGFIGVKLIKKMLRSHPQALYFAILGLIVGSLAMIWPGFSLDTTGLISIILMVFFAAVAFFFSKKS